MTEKEKKIHCDTEIYSNKYLSTFENRNDPHQRYNVFHE